MLTITITDKPEMGKRDRVCKYCGHTYRGWNFVLCPDCESIGTRNLVTVERCW